VSAGGRIRVVIVDDHAVVRQGVASLLEGEEDIEVVAEGGSAAEALALCRKHEPDVMLLDLRLPDGSGVDVIRALLAERPERRIVVLSTYDGDEDIFRALEAGARSYLLKNMSYQQILEALRAAHAGERRLPREIARRMNERPPARSLSSRELEVLRLVAQGESNQAIAAALGLSEGTVKTHVAHILTKLSVDDRTAAVTAALQRGILKI
jgi:two-component system NarL family response regulator